MAKDHKQGKRGLNIIIVGCGKVGASLTEQLYKEVILHWWTEVRIVFRH